ncbi:MAG: ABC transporter permease subunit [Planctomycetes bacterium]|nr:ABC transporter permease subunit [Planctomycetota bacterium]
MSEPATPQRTSPTRDALRILLRNRPAVAALVAILLLSIAALSGKFLTGKPPTPEESKIIAEAEDLGDKVKMDRNAWSVIDPLQTELKDKLERPYVLSLLAAPFGGYEADSAESIQAAHLEAQRAEGVPKDKLRKLTDAEIAERRREGIGADTKRTYWLGTDHLGRDVLARLWAGSSISLTVGLLVVGISVLIGISLGGIAGYFGRSRVGLPFLIMLMSGLVGVVSWAIDLYALILPSVVACAIAVALQIAVALMGRRFAAVAWFGGFALVTLGVFLYTGHIASSTPEGRLLNQASLIESKAYDALILSRDFGADVKLIENGEAGAPSAEQRLTTQHAFEIAMLELELEHLKYRALKFRLDRETAQRLGDEELERATMLESKDRKDLALALRQGAEKRNAMLKDTQKGLDEKLASIDKSLDEAAQKISQAAEKGGVNEAELLKVLQPAREAVAGMGVSLAELDKLDAELQKAFEEKFAADLNTQAKQLQDGGKAEEAKQLTERAKASETQAKRLNAQIGGPRTGAIKEAQGILAGIVEHDVNKLPLNSETNEPRIIPWFNLRDAQNKAVKAAPSLLQGSNALLERRAALRGEYHTKYATLTKNNRDALIKAELLSGWERYPLYAKLRHFMTPVLLSIIGIITTLLLAVAAQRSADSCPAPLRKLFLPTLSVDDLVMRFTEVMLTIPTLVLIIAILAMFAKDVYIVMAVLGLTGWMGTTRFVRAEILSLREQDFVQAARALGVSDFRIVWRHLVPNAISPVLVSATLGVASAILLESTLSFLGIGATPDQPTWGSILSEGRQYINDANWLTWIPGVAILITVLAFNLLGEGLREAFNPKLRGR